MSIPQGPLVAFFSQYHGFHYDHTESASSEFRRLSALQAWGRDGREYAREQYKKALIRQFNLNYGTDVNALESWHLLCTYIGIAPLPATLEACKMAVQRTHVNLVDLVDVFGTDRRVRVFFSVQELSEYTKSTEKYFPRNEIEAGALLEYLLRRINNPWSDMSGEDVGRLMVTQAAAFNHLQSQLALVSYRNRRSRRGD